MNLPPCRNRGAQALKEGGGIAPRRLRASPTCPSLSRSGRGRRPSRGSPPALAAPTPSAAPWCAQRCTVQPSHRALHAQRVGVFRRAARSLASLELAEPSLPHPGERHRGNSRDRLQPGRDLGALVCVSSVCPSQLRWRRQYWLPFSGPGCGSATRGRTRGRTRATSVASSGCWPRRRRKRLTPTRSSESRPTETPSRSISREPRATSRRGVGLMPDVHHLLESLGIGSTGSTGSVTRWRWRAWSPPRSRFATPPAPRASRRVGSRGWCPPRAAWSTRSGPPQLLELLQRPPSWRHPPPRWPSQVPGPSPAAAPPALPPVADAAAPLALGAAGPVGLVAAVAPAPLAASHGVLAAAPVAAPAAAPAPGAPLAAPLVAAPAPVPYLVLVSVETTAYGFRGSLITANGSEVIKGDIGTHTDPRHGALLARRLRSDFVQFRGLEAAGDACLLAVISLNRVRWRRLWRDVEASVTEIPFPDWGIDGALHHVVALPLDR
ncbi:unnamed protein product [Prorocentrum cordatum]|uniref:Uncharacterized protein n=1 Tax=Prorocentrum cordatum TaxID=2364126 RepID=A0ABN9SU35_9DINO|nr:unnamed protein product [Polarella glacialis]